MIIKRIDVISCGKVLGALYALVGLILGAIFSLLSLVGMAAAAQNVDGIGPMVFGIGAIIVLPIFYGVLGFFGGMIGAGLYNLVASIIGGIKLDIQP